MSRRIIGWIVAFLFLGCFVVFCGENRSLAAWWHGPHECGTCPRCGCPMECKVVPTKKEVKKDAWIVKTEPYCLVMPGGPCHLNSPIQSCDKSGCDPCAVELAKPQNPPRPVAVKTRQILERKEVICLVPSYKCTPFCPRCSATAAQATTDRPLQAEQVPMTEIPQRTVLAPLIPCPEQAPTALPAPSVTIGTPSSAVTGKAGTPTPASSVRQSTIQDSTAPLGYPWNPSVLQRRPVPAPSRMIAIPPPPP